jgi:hypothetical protein
MKNPKAISLILYFLRIPLIQISVIFPASSYERFHTYSLIIFLF